MPHTGDKDMEASESKTDPPPSSVDSKMLADAGLKLIPETEEKQQPFFNKASTTLVFLDWDDTLLASSFLFKKGYQLHTPVEPSDMEQLKELETSVIALINLALSAGYVHIVTNAETGWVEQSAQKFMPGVVPYLDKLRILSARSTYEGLYPDAPYQWKYFAFQDGLKHVFGENTTLEKNILSFGDSHVEREAVRAVTKTFSRTKTKSVKFAEHPSTEQLRRQLELVMNCFHYIYHHDGDLDLKMTVTVNLAPSSPPPSSPPPVESDDTSSAEVNC